MPGTSKVIDFEDDDSQTPYVRKLSVEEAKERSEPLLPWLLNVTNDCRARLGDALESLRYQYMILFLVLVDFLIVLVEIGVSLLQERVCNAEGEVEVAEGPRFMQKLGASSLIITAFFTVEILLRLFAFGPQYYTRHCLHLFDAMVVIGSFVIVIVSHSKEEEELGSMLIVFRAWRIIRVIDATAVTTAASIESEKRALKQELEEANLKIEQITEELAKKCSPEGRGGESDAGLSWESERVCTVVHY